METYSFFNHVLFYTLYNTIMFLLHIPRIFTISF